MIEPNYKEMYKDWNYSALNKVCLDLVHEMSKKYPSKTVLSEQLSRNSEYQALKELLFEKRMRS